MDHPRNFRPLLLLSFARPYLAERHHRPARKSACGIGLCFAVIVSFLFRFVRICANMKIDLFRRSRNRAGSERGLMCSERGEKVWK